MADRGLRIADRGLRNGLRIAGWALAFRIVSSILALFVVLTFPLDRNVPPQSSVWGNPSPFWDAFARHDAGWYFDIARKGYDFSGAMAGGRSNIAYAPVYPMLMRYVGRIFGRSPGDIYLGGIVVSWLAFVLAMVALARLAALDLSSLSRGSDFTPADLSRRSAVGAKADDLPDAERAALLTAIFPFSCFFGAVYTESTFLLFTVLSFYCFRTRRWAAAGVCGALATATRVTGILMWPALAWTAWRALGAGPERAQAGERVEGRKGELAQGVASMRDVIGATLALVVAALGFGGYCFFVYQHTGDPFLWATALTRWGAGYHPGGAPWSAPLALAGALVTHPYVFLTSGPMAVYDTLYGVTALLFVAAIPFVWLKFDAAYGLFLALNLYVPLSSGTVEGLGRYCSVLFPVFIWLASIRSRRLSTAIVVVFAMFYTLGLALFVTLRPLF
jgi:hypothetical protein